jgi:hypothetical protein
MADAALLRKGMGKVALFALVFGYGYWALWQNGDVPVQEWFWKLGRRDQVIFAVWAIISAALLYDMVLALFRGVVAPDPNAPPRPGRR